MTCAFRSGSFVDVVPAVLGRPTASPVSGSNCSNTGSCFIVLMKRRVTDNSGRCRPREKASSMDLHGPISFSRCGVSPRWSRANHLPPRTLHEKPKPLLPMAVT